MKGCYGASSQVAAKVSDRAPRLDSEEQGLITFSCPLLLDGDFRESPRAVLQKYTESDRPQSHACKNLSYTLREAG